MGKRNKNNNKPKNRNNTQFTTKFRYFTRKILGDDSIQLSDHNRVSHGSSNAKHQESDPSLKYIGEGIPKNRLNGCSNKLQPITDVKEKIEPEIITIEDSPFPSVKSKAQLQCYKKNCNLARKKILQNTIRSIKRRNMVFSTPYKNQNKFKKSFGNISAIQRSNIKRTAVRSQSTSSSISSSNYKIATTNIKNDTVITIDDDDDDEEEEDCILIEPKIVEINLVDSILNEDTEIPVNKVLQNNEKTTKNMTYETVTSEDTFINYSNTVVGTDEREDGEILTLDETVCDTTVVEKTLVNDVCALDFIPLGKIDAIANDRRKLSTQNSFTPKPKHQQAILQNSLFTRSEKKELIKYNSNTYNPNPQEITKGQKRTIIIDGSNVAFSHGLTKFSVRGLNICIDFFIEQGHKVKAVVPQHRRKHGQSDNPELLERLFEARKVIFTPSKNLSGQCVSSYDDRQILQLATEMDGVVISNDNYRDLIRESAAFKKIIENRVIGYTWCDDIFILPKDPYGRFGPPLHAILNRM